MERSAHILAKFPKLLFQLKGLGVMYAYRNMVVFKKFNTCICDENFALISAGSSTPTPQTMRSQVICVLGPTLSKCFLAAQGLEVQCGIQLGYLRIVCTELGCVFFRHIQHGDEKAELISD